MNKTFNLVGLTVTIALLFTTVSCTSVKYLYDGKQYSTASEAASAQQQAINALVAQITPVAKRVKGSLTVLVPTDDYITANWATRKDKMTQNQVDLMAKFEKNGIIGSVDAIRKRGLFDAVTFRQCVDPAKEAFSEDFALFLSATPKMEWWLKLKSLPGKAPIAIEMPASSLSPLQRITFWLDSVEKAAVSAQ